MIDVGNSFLTNAHSRSTSTEINHYNIFTTSFSSSRSYNLVHIHVVFLFKHFKTNSGDFPKCVQTIVSVEPVSKNNYRYKQCFFHFARNFFLWKKTYYCKVLVPICNI